MKIIAKTFLAGALAMGALGSANATEGWPDAYDGVMFQAFYWDSYTDTKWTNLSANADEYSKYFNLIWIPNSAKAANSRSMGYDPVYWFTNYNSTFGTQTELKQMIRNFKRRNVGVIADVVINHRNGKSNWLDFPAEEWNGTTWQIGSDGITSGDEVWKQTAYQDKTKYPRGAADTGDDFEGGRDLDHTNANVQENCKAYCKFLIDELDYAGFRLDMVKGYAGKYTKMYNEYANPTYSVGEYWDGNTYSVRKWIDDTEKSSAAFDFPLKYAINSAFSGGNMSKLATTGTRLPAGLIGDNDYKRYSVTFVDNHDTYREGSRFIGDIVAANAYILTMPGTPCVFLPHYQQYAKSIQRLINIRKSVGITSTSTVSVTIAEKATFYARVKGTNGALFVRIGEPSDKANPGSTATLVAEGDNYSVWSTVEISGEELATEDKGESFAAPAKLYIIGTLAEGSWKPNAGKEMTKSGNLFTATGVELTASTTAQFSFAEKLSTTASWDPVNSANRYGAVSDQHSISLGTPEKLALFPTGFNNAFSFTAPKGVYNITVDFDHGTVTLADPSGLSDLGLDAPEASAAVYYDLQGNRVVHPAKGAYIKVADGKATKIIL